MKSDADYLVICPESDASILSRTRSSVWHTLLPIENEGGKLEYSSRSLSEALQGSTRSDIIG